jgi:hypothetical protein
MRDPCERLTFAPGDAPDYRQLRDVNRTAGKRIIINSAEDPRELLCRRTRTRDRNRLV